MTPRPPSVLRDTVYLWGINLSHDPQFTSRESVFVGRAWTSVHIALSSAQNQQQNTLYILQAEILLATYFFHCNRPLEGKFHASAAVSLAYMCNLHKILSGQQSLGAYNFLTAGPAWLPPPIDPTDEGERIHAWWMTFALDKSWVVALASPSMITETTEPGTVIDTPWPLTMEKYNQACPPCCYPVRALDDVHFDLCSNQRQLDRTLVSPRSASLRTFCPIPTIRTSVCTLRPRRCTIGLIGSRPTPIEVRHRCPTLRQILIFPQT